MIAAVSLAIALAGPAIAQETPAPAAPVEQQMAPAAAQPMAADAMPPAPMKHRHHRRHHRTGSSHRGHVPGNPPVIDHSGDHLIVAPTSTTITVPPAH